MFNDDGCDQISKAIASIDADRLMYKNIMNSNCIKQDILPKNNINNAIEYLKNNEVPQIDELYQALIKRVTFRHYSVYVSDKNNSKIISAANVGIQHENIDPNELQQLMDFAYEYDQSDKTMVLQIIEYDKGVIYLSAYEAERIAAEQRSRAQQKYRIQRQEFRATTNDLQLLLIRRLQKTVITNVQDFLQISDIIDRYNQ
ncbi:MAG: hypothetical protein EZS28_022904 [Streblomastix strix]|uniref:Uncharacterized protein n=1 Tax=Streblomastix strix TaxID=222440 RepID=A0A5J4VG48_9EUKA|nr:MAG: hypothetical protein EZS28_022904 [Streblomastix strix]